MSKKIHYSSILCPPTLCYGDKENSSTPNSPELNLNGIKGLLLSKNHKDTAGLNKEDVGSPLEFYVRSMLCSCASTISIPAYGRSMWASPRQIKSGVSESASKRLHFVDRSHAIWTAVERYLNPIYNDIKDGLAAEYSSRGQPTPEKGGNTPLDGIAWDLYLILLAVRGHSEVPIAPSTTLKLIDTLSKRSNLRAENRTRLAIIRGIFTLYEKSEDLPGFRCVNNRGQLLRERLDEILDDAYLLDASRLRRFFGLQSNTRAIKKDLQKLTSFIARNRPWAKGAVMATSQSALLAGSASEMIDKVLDIFPELVADCSSPILIEPDALLADMGKLFVVSSTRLPFRKKENWMVTVKMNQTH